MRLVLLLASLPLFVSSPLLAQTPAPTSISARPARSTISRHNSRNKAVEIDVGSAIPVPTYDVKSIVVKYVNRFRYDINSLTASTPIAAATPPSLLTASAGSAKAAPPAGNALAQTAAVPLADCSQSDPKNPWPPASVAGQGETQAQRVAKCWVEIRSDVAVNGDELLNIRQQINQTIRNAVAEQACYTRKTKTFSQVLLTHADAVALLTFAEANGTAQGADVTAGAGCNIDGSTAWPFSEADNAEQSLNQDQNTLISLASAPGYPEWLGAKGSPNDTANTALGAQITGLLAEVRSYGKGTAGTGTDPAVAESYAQFQAVVQTNLQWRDRLAKIASAAKSSTPTDPDNDEQLKQEIAANPCNEWYGRGRTDAISIHAVDITPSAPTVPDIKVVTNTCTPLSILSTGIGVTFLPSPVYGFVPDATGAQIIGKTAVNDKSILYALLYDVRLTSLGKKSGIELFASPGVGLTSASSTTTTDWLGGLSLSFARRLIFVTGSVDFGNRTELLPGFKEGSPKGTLSSVPTRTNMKTGGMISVTFGIAPSS
jgi:hypothetical protein